MAIKRHHVQRGAVNTKSGHSDTSHRGNVVDGEPCCSTLGGNMPFHPVMPNLPPSQGELFFECVLFLYSVLALFMQYINLFKTTWWLPNSFTHYILKIHLIDPYLLSCVGLILGRKVTWCFLKKMTILPPGVVAHVPPVVKTVDWLLKCFMLCAVMTSFMFSFVRVLSAYSIPVLSFLFYPIFVYVFLYWNQFTTAYNSGEWRFGFISGLSKNVSDSVMDEILDPGCWVQHRCSNVADTIRQEAHILILDLSKRLKKSFFSAFTAAYFAIFIPCLFSPSTLYVDLWWVSQMFAIVFMTSLSLFLAYLLPLKYCDLLHKCVSHLGGWQLYNPSAKDKEGPSIVKVPVHPQDWSPGKVWTEGDVVYWDKVYYQAVGKSVAGIPGLPEHNRLFKLSEEPIRILNLLCILEIGLILVQFFMLVHSTEWQHIVTIVSLMFANYLLLFKVFKDKVILTRIYHPSPEDISIMRKFDAAISKGD